MYVRLPLITTFDTPAFCQKWGELVLFSIVAKCGQNKISNPFFTSKQTLASTLNSTATAWEHTSPRLCCKFSEKK